MDIVTIDFEKPLIFSINGELVQLVAFKTVEPGNVKFGIDAPRCVQVHREEIYRAIKQKESLVEDD